ncbi:MAG: 4-alpha-glucanotransferase, partial [Panacagrimonas sp.]
PGLRRRGDGGIGDFGGVAQLVPALARHGADAIALSPAHAGFGAWPDRFAPYSPSSRLMRNPLLADPHAVFDVETVDGVIALCNLAETFAELERTPQIDPGRAARAKTTLFRGLYACLDASGRRTAFDQWRASQGPLVRQHAVFEALHARFSFGPEPVGHWRNWPSEFRMPWTPIVKRFADEHAAEVEFAEFLQWLAECSVAAAQGAARHAGMAIGLIGDLAVGTDSAGSHAWSRQHDLLLGLRIGAPPDPLNVKGQDWGLAALSPRTLRREGFRPFVELLRANLANVGGLRIDHVFGLERLWLIADGTAAHEGAYVHYPLTDLLRLMALESWRHGAVIVGEDLGTMPDGFQSQLIDAGLLGMRVMWFQRDGGLFVEPARWPEATVAMTSTHDLPTVAGWWSGADLSWRAQLDLLDVGQSEAQAHAARAHDRQALWDAFIHAQVVGADRPLPIVTQGAEVALAAAAFIGRTPCGLALLPIEDALALTEQPNIPGTVDEHPNWLRRLPGDAESLLEDATPDAVLSALQRARLDGPE